MIRFSTILLAFCLFMVPAVLYASGVHRYALVVGVNKAPADTLETLRYADDDAVRYHKIFSAYAEKSVLLTLLDEESQRIYSLSENITAQMPERARFDEAKNLLFNEMENSKNAGFETEFFFVYSGHGRLSPDGEGRVALLDGELSRSDLYQEVLEKSPADYNHLIIDACSAYYFVHSKGEEETVKEDRTGRIRREEINDFFDTDQLSKFPNTGVVLSTSNEAQTHEWSRFSSGVFSHEVRSGLLGGADITGDGLIEYSELLAFVEAANHHISVSKARLKVSINPPEKRLGRPLFDTNALESCLILKVSAEHSGRYFIDSANGERYVDWNRTNEHPLTIALLSHDIYFIRDIERKLEYRVSTLENETTSIRLDRLTPLNHHDSAKGTVEEDFRKSLFKEPFGEGFYNGVVASLDLFPAQNQRQSPLIEKQSDSSSSWKKPLAWSLLGIGIGAVISGGVLSWKAADDASRYRELISSRTSLKKRSEVCMIGAITAFGVSALTLGTSVFLLSDLYSDKTKKQRPDTTDITVAPVVVVDSQSGFLGIAGNL